MRPVSAWNIPTLVPGSLVGLRNEPRLFIPRRSRLAGCGRCRPALRSAAAGGTGGRRTREQKVGIGSCPRGSGATTAAATPAWAYQAIAQTKCASVLQELVLSKHDYRMSAATLIQQHCGPGVVCFCLALYARAWLRMVVGGFDCRRRAHRLAANTSLRRLPLVSAGLHDAARLALSWQHRALAVDQGSRWQPDAMAGSCHIGAVDSFSRGLWPACGVVLQAANSEVCVTGEHTRTGSGAEVLSVAGCWLAGAAWLLTEVGKGQDTCLPLAV